MPTPSIHKLSTPEDRSLPVFAEFDQLADRIRDRAFSLFNGRGCSPGHAMDDWLQAEREICWPAAELSETDDQYVLDIALAGFAPADIEIAATPSELIVKARREARQKKRGKRKDPRVHWSEFSSEAVYRRVALPQTVDVNRVSARFENGLLKISAPKMPESKATSRQISIASDQQN